MAGSTETTMQYKVNSFIQHDTWCYSEKNYQYSKVFEAGLRLEYMN